jgi:uncharacterized LabA/DUF88 family protein
MTMRVMIFIDGSYYSNASSSYCKENNIKFDMKKLPHLLVQTLSNRLNETLSCIEIIYCASLPANVHYKDKQAVSKQQNFFEVLQNKCDYTVELYEINFKGRRLLKQDRGSDPWEPKEKCVDIAVATNLLFHKDRYDIAILITGDRDFLPAINKVRELGKKVIISSFSDSCSNELFENEDEVIWLDDLRYQMILERSLT